MQELRTEREPLVSRALSLALSGAPLATAEARYDPDAQPGAVTRAFATAGRQTSGAFRTAGRAIRGVF